jgi:hypothetical protein
MRTLKVLGVHLVHLDLVGVVDQHRMQFVLGQREQPGRKRRGQHITHRRQRGLRGAGGPAIDVGAL